MKTGIFIKSEALLEDARLKNLVAALKDGGMELYRIRRSEDIQKETELVLSIGGDGTFLSTAMQVGPRNIPVLGVNLGRMGFLSENYPEEVVEPILKKAYEIENRALLRVGGAGVEMYPYALNELAVYRSGASVLGVTVTIDGQTLPQYWADGLLVATSSGSTAYNLSVGGPICMPSSKVLIIAPIAPHNLNVRPLVVPRTSIIEIEMSSRNPKVMLSLDNRTSLVDASAHLSVRVAQFSLRRVRLPNASFVKALTSKLYWGEDIRNGK